LEAAGTTGSVGKGVAFSVTSVEAVSYISTPMVWSSIDTASGTTWSSIDTASGTTWSSIDTASDTTWTQIAA
jgi:hypothetical protein